MQALSVRLACGTEIHYQLDRRARRTIGLKITADGLVVHAPLRLSLPELEKILQEKSHWILQKLQNRPQKAAAKSWQNGEVLYWLGNEIKLNIQLLNGFEIPKNAQTNQVHNQALLMQNQLDIVTRKSLSAAQIQRLVIAWFNQQALLDFVRRAEVFAAKLGVKTPPVTLSSAKTRWGSCTSRGDVRLNWRLIQAPPHIINYVVCHELAHLKHMNHSPKFWAQVSALFPDFNQAERDLKAWSNKLYAIDL